MTEAPKKILLIQTAFIGDVILATPLLETLKSWYPESEIDFLVRKGNESLLDHNPKLNQVLVWDKSRKYASLWGILKQIRREKYDLLINLQRFFSTGMISFFSGARTKVGFSQNPFSFSYSFRKPFRTESGLHEVDRNLSLLEFLGKEQELHRRPVLYPSSDDFAKAEELTGKSRYITISPASVWFTKATPSRVWAEFIELLPEDIGVVLLGAKGDLPIAKEIAKQVEKSPVNLMGKTSFLQSAAMMKNAVLNYSNDSAPIHLASGVDAPAVQVYCSTIPEFGFSSLSGFHRIIEIHGLDCRPCNLHGKAACPLGHFNCGNSHDPRSLLKAFREVISFD